MTFFCCDPRRLEVIRIAGSANAIEFLEVRDNLEPEPALRQRTLFVRLLRPAAALTLNNVRIDGGERPARVPVEWVARADNLPPGVDPSLADGIDDLPRTLVVRTTVAGDFSRYTLHLRMHAGSDQPPPGFDPKLSSIEFSFKVECPSEFDCGAISPCPPRAAGKPAIDYLAKDFSGFRRLMLDRLNLLTPRWSERSAADLGVALVELVAYAADNLSYRQDAVANEAYLGTARQRTSIRRHARLVDYALHDGCNARAWVHLDVTADTTLPRGTPMLTRVERLPVEIRPASTAWREALEAGAAVFETAHSMALFTDHNRLPLYTWGDRGCCLPRGATHATLAGAHPALRENDVIVFREVISPTNFDTQSADPEKRWAVRLTAVRQDVDPSGQLFGDPSADAALTVTEIDWDPTDALPFPLCISVTERPDLVISEACGNNVLVDHGQTLRGERLGPVRAARLRRTTSDRDDLPCRHSPPDFIPIRFRPSLKHSAVTQGFDLESDWLTPPGHETWRAAGRLVTRDPHEALPLVHLDEDHSGGVPPRWTPQRDLLASDEDAPHFVVETTNDGSARLRFGDDRHGRRPNEGATFSATYRVGNGPSGNVGADSICHVVTTADGVFARVENPMPASGGVEPEDVEAARRDAPHAFRVQERAVTAADYAVAAERRADVQRAAATFRWTGSWHTVFVTADRVGGGRVDARYERALRRHLERFRMAGYDLEVDAPRYVALDVALFVCVKAGYFRSEVLRAIRDVLGSDVRPDGRRGVFHPDNFSFGDAVYLSPIVAAAHQVDGVEAVRAHRFARLASPSAASLEAGVIPMGRLEIAQLANDPNWPERGRLTLSAGGGA